jgi:hypothetical protein
MSESNPRPDANDDSERFSHDDSDVELVADVVTSPNGPVCVIHPESSFLTAWITAGGDSFVALDDMR